MNARQPLRTLAGPLLAALLLLLSACADDAGGGDTDTGPDDCIPGATACACTEAGACTDASDACVADLCVPRTDCTGELGCACDATGACADGLTCDSGLCTVENGLILSVTGGDARACDVLVRTAGRPVAEVVYPAGVRGRDRSRNESTAIAMIRTSDTALTGTAATLVLEGTDAASAGDISAVDATCYDRLGNVDAAATVQAE